MYYVSMICEVFEHVYLSFDEIFGNELFYGNIRTLSKCWIFDLIIESDFVFMITWLNKNESMFGGCIMCWLSWNEWLFVYFLELCFMKQWCFFVVMYSWQLLMIVNYEYV